MVVILIIAILAAIAIPVFVRQRTKGYIAQMESALKNAATSQESYFVDNSVYADTLAKMEAEGLRYANGVTIDAVNISQTSFCVQASHATIVDVTIEPMAISSDVTTPQLSATCAAGVLVP